MSVWWRTALGIDSIKVTSEGTIVALTRWAERTQGAHNRTWRVKVHYSTVECTRLLPAVRKT